MVTENEKVNSCARACEAAWPYVSAVINVVTIFVSVLQAGFLIGIFVLIIIASICIFYEMHQFTGYLDDFTGLGVGSMLQKQYGFYIILIVAVMLLLAYCPLHMSIKLCQGLEKNELKWVVQGTFVAAGVWGIRVYHITWQDWYGFPEDKTVLYCALYAGYLVMLVIRCFEIQMLNKQIEAITVAITQQTQEVQNAAREIDTEVSRMRATITALRASCFLNFRARLSGTTTPPYSRMSTNVV